jgi:uncharacterized membrane protein HdeD (DUF308 family)
MLMILLAGNWWALALRGLLAVLFGITALVMPGLTLAMLVLLYGGYAIVFGVLLLVIGFRLRALSQRAASLMTGLAS